MPDAFIYLLPFLVGGILSGTLLGLVPFIIAQYRRRRWLGFFALIICAASGAALGAILAFPVATSFSVAILLSKKAQPKPAPASRPQFSEAADSEPQLD